MGDTALLGASRRERLPDCKQPRLIETIEELRRNAMGKVQKAALRERCRSAFA